MKKPLDFNFTRALARGHVSYDATVGTWWEHRSADDAHKRAYRHSAEHTRDSLRKAMKKNKISSPLIVDYACGGGHYLLDETSGGYAGSTYTFLDADAARALVEEAGLKVDNFERWDWWKNNLSERHSWWLVWASK